MLNLPNAPLGHKRNPVLQVQPTYNFWPGFFLNLKFFFFLNFVKSAIFLTKIWKFLKINQGIFQKFPQIHQFFKNFFQKFCILGSFLPPEKKNIYVK